MKDKLVYTGVATLIRRVDGKTTYNKCYNNGTNELFELYARALVGHNISSLLPYSLDLMVKGTSKLRNTIYVNPLYVPVPKLKDESINPYNVPFARMEALITRDMIDNIPQNTDEAELCLKSKQNNKLASITVNKEFLTNLTTTAPGVQLILVWDLYVDNIKTS